MTDKSPLDPDEQDVMKTALAILNAFRLGQGEASYMLNELSLVQMRELAICYASMVQAYQQFTAEQLGISPDKFAEGWSLLAMRRYE